MNASTAGPRLTATATAVVAATVLAAPAVHAQRDLVPTGSDVNATASAGSDSADLVTERKIQIARCRATAALADCPDRGGTRLAEVLAGDIAYVVETRKALYARFLIEHARELAANR